MSSAKGRPVCLGWIQYERLGRGYATQRTENGNTTETKLSSLAMVPTFLRVLPYELLFIHSNTVNTRISGIRFDKLLNEKGHDIGLSTHPGTGVDGASGRGWKLADFLLKHV